MRQECNLDTKVVGKSEGYADRHGRRIQHAAGAVTVGIVIAPSSSRRRCAGAASRGRPLP